MATRAPPLDELRFDDQAWLQRNGGVHSNSVLFYFAESPWFVKSSNNALVTNQANMNPNMLYMIQTREAFEEQLDSRSGLEFRIAQEPAETAPGTGTGVWLIRKQYRKKRAPYEDEITVLASYYVVDPFIFMAPLLSDVLGGRMLAVIYGMNNFFSTAAALPNFSPALGHTYAQPETAKKAIESQTGQNSKENTPLPDSQWSKKSQQTANSNTYLENRLFEETLNIAWRYGDEYMDEIPITGQPGEFLLSSTGRKEKERPMVPAAIEGPLSAASKPKPPTIKTDVPTAKATKSAKSPRTPGMPKRRKSKSGAATPAK